MEHKEESRRCGLLYCRGNGPSEAGMPNDTLIFNYSFDDDRLSDLDIDDAEEK